jgi:hypothetical protein
LKGWLYDIFGNYNSAFYLTGVCVFISGALVAPIARSSNCLTIEDSSTEVTDSSRPSSPKIEDMTNSMHETHDNSNTSQFNSLNISNLNSLSLNDKVIKEGKYFNGVISKSFDNVSNAIVV